MEAVQICCGVRRLMGESYGTASIQSRDGICGEPESVSHFNQGVVSAP